MTLSVSACSTHAHYCADACPIYDRRGHSMSESEWRERERERENKKKIVRKVKKKGNSILH